MKPKFFPRQGRFILVNSEQRLKCASILCIDQELMSVKNAANSLTLSSKKLHQNIQFFHLKIFFMNYRLLIASTPKSRQFQRLMGTYPVDSSDKSNSLHYCAFLKTLCVLRINVSNDLNSLSCNKRQRKIESFLSPQDCSRKL